MEKELLLVNRINESKKDLNQLNNLITDYKPFIAKTVKEHVGHYVSYGEDDELSIGMMAFTEAVNAYDSSKGTFLSFAKRIICLRLIDYYRKNIKYDKQIQKTKELDADENIINLTNRVSIKQFEQNEENMKRKLEILTFKEELLKWNIEFKDLIENSPKQEKLRKQYIKIAQLIVNDSVLIKLIFNNKRLPIKEIQKQTLINRKKIERGRYYIIACVIILNGDFKFMQEYIKWR